MYEHTTPVKTNRPTTMTYKEQIDALISNVQLIDFASPRDIASIPTQVSSNFIINREQGDWAEKLITKAINENAKNHVAVKYGKSDDLIAGETGFNTFFEEFQTEMDTIGKRPDILIFKKEDYDPQLGKDICHIPHEQIDEYVKKAIAGIEVRSSAFLINRYEEQMQNRTAHLTQKALSTKERILHDYCDLLEAPSRVQYIHVLEALNEETIPIADFKVPGWHSTERLAQLNDLFRQLKSALKEVQKRSYLSITPKVEDLKVVYKWIETFNVPHYYFQVFFDKVYGISFKNILEIISNPDNEPEIFSVESDVKNQNKTTIKIKAQKGIEVAYKVDEPNHKSIRRELERGRLLFYVTFSGGVAYLDVENIKNILNIAEPF